MTDIYCLKVQCKKVLVREEKISSEELEMEGGDHVVDLSRL